jgi:hypothetical protein
LWDFSWYTQAAPGKPFHDLDAAFAEAVERGYNTVRICAMPFLLFGEHDVDSNDIRITGLGRGVGERIRWYNVEGGGPGFDGRERLRELFEAARRHDCFVILSSWEYQQSPAFRETRDWYDALLAVPHGQRHVAMANAMVRLIDFLKEAGLADRVAYAELHNEVDLTKLIPEWRDGDQYWSQRELVADAVEIMQRAHPDVLVTSCYGIPPYHDMSSVPDNGQVAHFHIYVYGVLGALDEWAGVRIPPPEFPRPELLSLLRDDAPSVEEFAKSLDSWRLAATEVLPSMLYAYEWVDTAKWDRWLYENYQSYRVAMVQSLDDKLAILARWAEHHKVPAVIGEGWIGYTPLFAEFEDGPVGQGLAEHAIERCIELGFWGAVLGSNSAPHHPGWRNVEWQQKWNKRLRESADPG